MRPWLLLLAGLEVPAVLGWLDCYHRRPAEFAGGAADRRSWLRWLALGAATAWLLVGNAVLLGYYYSVVRRQTPLGRG